MMDTEFNTIATVVTSVLIGIFGFYQFLKRVRKNGKVTSLSEPEKRINYQEAYSELQTKYIELERDYRHDQTRNQQAIEVLERTVKENKQEFEQIKQQALEFKIAREALEERHDRNVKNFATTIQEQAIQYTTERMQDAAKIVDLSNALATAREDVAKLQTEMNAFKAELKEAEAKRVEIERLRKSCQEQIEELQKQNAGLRADLTILQRKLEQSKDVPDTDELNDRKVA